MLETEDHRRDSLGLKYVYAGNIPGRTRDYENTVCPTCGTTLVERISYVIQGYHLTAYGKCPKCKTEIPGIWTDKPALVKTGGHGLPRPVTW